MTTQPPPSDHPLAPRWQKPCVGVPRQFNVGGLMLLVTMCAVLFAAMQSLGANAETFGVISVLFVGVAAGQVLLFDGKRPRDASLWVGGCLFPVEIIALYVYVTSTSPYGYGSMFSGGSLCVLIFSIPAGAILGYIAGTLSAGIFLVRQHFDKDSEEEAVAGWLRLRPATEADIDTLLEWTQSRRLFERWSDGSLSYPLDHDQMSQHLQALGGEPTGRHAFVAVCARTERPLGYVELHHIPWQNRSARITHAMVAPDESDRERLCMELLVAVVRWAFDEMDCHRVEAIATVVDRTTKDCFLGVGFRVEGTLRDAFIVNGHYRAAFMLAILEIDRLQKRPRSETT